MRSSATPGIATRKFACCTSLIPTVAVGSFLLLRPGNILVQGLLTPTGCSSKFSRSVGMELPALSDGGRYTIFRLLATHSKKVGLGMRWSKNERRAGWQSCYARARDMFSPLSASNGASVSEPVVYAQDALDDAWRSQRRIELDSANAKSGTLGERLMTALGRARPSAMFVENRDFMDSTLDNVVRIYCTHNLPSWSMPWQRLKQESSTSTGFVIDGRRIITNAHSVEYSTMIQVRRRGSDRKYQAVQLAVGEECDLAVLTVEEEGFWEDTSPLEFGELPELTDDVNVIGYPVGGDCISITAGVVSRVEMTTYAQAGQYLLSIQIDAAINPGNSGGPVVNDNGEVVGVAFQSLDADDVENIGYVVPVNVLEHFLEDVRRHGGRYLGFPRLGVSLQNLESPSLRGSLKMSPQQTGIMITGAEPTAPATGLLHARDVVMKVDGIKVANDGTIPFRSGERVALRYYFSQLFPEDEVHIQVLREEEVVDVTVPLYIPKILAPMHFDGRPPSYCVLGGLVFTVMSDPYLNNEWDEHAESLAHLLSLAQHRKRQTLDEEIVILTQVLAHKVNLGYEGMSNLQLLAFNGQAVRSLSHLVHLADANTEPFLRFDFFPDKTLVLDAERVAAVNDQICADNSIPSPRSLEFVEEEGKSGGGQDRGKAMSGSTRSPSRAVVAGPSSGRRSVALTRGHGASVSGRKLGAWIGRRRATFNAAAPAIARIATRSASFLPSRISRRTIEVSTEPRHSSGIEGAVHGESRGKPGLVGGVTREGDTRVGDQVTRSKRRCRGWRRSPTETGTTAA